MKKVNILWIISHPKYSVMIDFETTKIFKWVVQKLMKKRRIKIRIINKNKLRGYKADIVYVDEMKKENIEKKNKMFFGVDFVVNENVPPTICYGVSENGVLKIEHIGKFHRLRFLLFRIKLWFKNLK